MKMPVLALCAMLTAFALPATADTQSSRTLAFDGASGQQRTLLYTGESSDSELVKKRKHRSKHRHSSHRYRHHHHRHYYRPDYYRPYYYRPYYYRPYYYDPYRYSYPRRGGFYFRIF